MERTVAIRPETDLVPVHVHPCLAHRSIEQKFGLDSVRHGKLCPVPSDAGIRKPAGTSCLQCRLGLHILNDLHGLEIILYAERSGNCPVVRDTDSLPGRAIECHGGSPFGLAEMETPSGLQGDFITRRRRCRPGSRHWRGVHQSRNIHKNTGRKGHGGIFW